VREGFYVGSLFVVLAHDRPRLTENVVGVLDCEWDCAYPERDALANRRNVFAWGMLLLSGFATLLVGLALARNSRRRLERMLDRLVHRGVLITVDPLSQIKTDLKN
jgi:hypothetical protein